MEASATLLRRIEDIHRSEWSRSVAVLCKRYGDLQLAEDCVQEAFTIAVRTWGQSGIPGNPGGWLRTVAQRRLVDHLRRRRTQMAGAAQLATEIEINSSDQQDPVDAVDRAIEDDELALIFLCCHPAISVTDQVMLTLRIVAGIPPRDIAAAFLAETEAIRTRLLRAKRKIKAAGIPTTLPPPDVLKERFAQVHAVIYLIFNQGYLTSRGEVPFDFELVREATRLCEKLLAFVPDDGESHGLLSLLLLTDARSPARFDNGNNLVSLDDQDRDLWRKDQIVSGFNHLRNAKASGAPGLYTLQASIAAEHAKAVTFEQTNWTEVARLYEILTQIDGSPIYRINRSVAISFAEGPNAALSFLSEIDEADPATDNYLFHATRADLLARSGYLEGAITSYQRAIDELNDGTVKATLIGKVEKLSVRNL